MSTITSTFNAIDALKFNKVQKFEEGKIDSYVLRKHISLKQQNCFIQKEVSSVSTYVPTIKQNLKSQFEELQKLESEIRHVEEKVKELEVSKKLKLNKIEDLRKTIERVADEDSYDPCLFRPKRFMPRERQHQQRQTASTRYVQSCFVNSNENEETSCFEEESSGDGEAASGDCAKEGIQAYKPNPSSPSSDCLLCSCHWDHCLLFWQEYLPENKKPNKQN